MTMIKTGDVLFIKGSSPTLSRPIQKAQRIINIILYFLCREPYKDPIISHVMISIDKGLFLHAAGNGSVTYTTIEQRLSNSSNYLVYRNPSLFSNSGIICFTMLPKEYQLFVKRKFISENLALFPLVLNKSIPSLSYEESGKYIFAHANSQFNTYVSTNLNDYIFHHQHLKMKYENGKPYTEGLIDKSRIKAWKKRLYYTLSHMVNHKMTNSETYCSKYIANILEGLNAIDYGYGEILFPARLETDMDRDPKWISVKNQYTNIAANPNQLGKINASATQSLNNFTKLEQDAMKTQTEFIKIFHNIEKSISNSTSLHQLCIHIKETDSNGKKLEAVYNNSILEKRWNDLDISKEVQRLQNMILSKL